MDLFDSSEPFNLSDSPGPFNEDVFRSFLQDFNSGVLPLVPEQLISQEPTPSSEENKVTSDSNSSMERTLKSNALFKEGYCAKHVEAIHSFHTFKFQSPYIRAHLEQLSYTHVDNWPHIVNSDLCDLDENAVKRGKKRKTVEVPFGCSIQERTVFACGEYDLTDNHPVVRGCKRCYLSGHVCPLIQDGPWPCSICEKEGVGCVLLREPALKSACKICKENELECPFTADPKSRGACANCLITGDVCIYGPAKGTTRDGASLAERYPGLLAQELADRAFKSCDACRGGRGSNCSQLRKPSLGPCFQCHAANMSCTFTKEAPNKSQSSLPLRQSKIKVQEQEAAGSLKMIKTRLVHPVILDCDLKKNGGDMTAGCDICQRLSSVLKGRGVACPIVIDFPDKASFIESDGGHASQGHKPTQICSNCVKQRRTMIGCLNHHFARIPSQDPAHYTRETIAEWCLSGNANSAPFSWCSICPNAAYFSCVATIQNGALREGCGMALCPVCLVGYRFFGQDMQALIKDKMNTVASDPARENKGRVDLELLELGGLFSRKKK